MRFSLNYIKCKTKILLYILKKRASEIERERESDPDMKKQREIWDTAGEREIEERERDSGRKTEIREGREGGGNYMEQTEVRGWRVLT